MTRQVAARRGTEHPGTGLLFTIGPPSPPWLEPDVNDRLLDLAEAGVGAVVLVPIGFVSDHMEMIFDLDTEAAATAAKLGLTFARAATAGDHPAFVRALVDLMMERAAVARGETPETPVSEAEPSAGTSAPRLLPESPRAQPGRALPAAPAASPGPILPAARVGFARSVLNRPIRSKFDGVGGNFVR